MGIPKKRSTLKMIIKTAYNELLSVQEWANRFDLRSCVVPPKGKVFLQSDWAQIEVVALATVLDALLGHQSELSKIINGTTKIQGIEYPNDIHLMLGALILNRPYEEIFPLMKTDPVVKDARQMAKAAVFGIPGGMGIDSFITFSQDVYGVSLTRRQAIHLIKLYHTLTGGEMHAYFDYISTVWDKQVTQLVSKRVRGGLTYCSAANTLFQGLAADAAKYTMVALEWASEVSPEEFQELMPGLQSRGCLHNVGYQLNQFIHDEFIGVATDPGGDLDDLQKDYERAKKHINGSWDVLEIEQKNASFNPISLALVEKGLIMIDCARFYFRGQTIREEAQILRRWAK